jgi:hypothetical protein
MEGLFLNNVDGSTPDKSDTWQGLSSTMDMSLPSPSKTSSVSNSYWQPVYRISCPSFSSGEA